MKPIILLTDYLNRFESKHNDFPYRSGMMHQKLTEYFNYCGYNADFVSFSSIANSNLNFIDIPVLYTSQEDPGYYYKSFIEDIVHYVELKGGRLIPPYKYLKANNNKVFMELLRKELNLDSENPLNAHCFGTLEEAMEKSDSFRYPIVVKGAERAQGTTVKLARSKNSLKKIIKQVASSRNMKEEFRELVRSYKYSGYKKQSNYRSKFIIQQYLPNLKNDWKE